MNNSKTRRHRQRRNKLSRRMKKRGGVKHKSRSSIVNQFPIKSIQYPTFKKGRNTTTFDAVGLRGPTRYVLNTKLDEEEQHNAYDRFNHKFQSIQNSFLDNFNMLHQDQRHNGRWICVTAGKGKWYETDGSWEMLPKRVNWSDGDDIKNDAYVMSEDGKTAIFGENRKSNPTFCLNYMK